MYADISVSAALLDSVRDTITHSAESLDLMELVAHLKQRGGQQYHESLIRAALWILIAHHEAELTPDRRVKRTEGV